MSENYIVINGKRAELTEEQLKQLGIEVPKANPFERVVTHTTNDFYSYYFINSYGQVTEATDKGFFNGNGMDDLRFRAANYCTDKGTMEQRALHETLNRLLWRYSMEHEGDKINWDNETQKKAFIYYDHCSCEYIVAYDYRVTTVGEIYFHTAEVAESAIKEIIEPFMAAHPEFVW